MTVFLTVIAAILTALLLIVGVFRLSMWLTNRTPLGKFKRKRSDASDVNGGGFMF